MVKSETPMRSSFQTRLQLLLWETVIRILDSVRRLRSGLLSPCLPKIKIPALTGKQAFILVISLILGAASGLLTGAILAILSLYR